MTKGYSYEEIGRRIKALRGDARQKDWAIKLGCDQGYISQVENGVTKPSLAFLKGVSTLTNSSIDWILTGRGERKIGDCAALSSVPGNGNGSGVDDVIWELKENPKILMAVNRLLKMKDRGGQILQSLTEMDDEKLNGLAILLGSRSLR